MSEWKLEITRVENGYVLWAPPEDEEHASREWVIEDDVIDELKSHENLLWDIMEFFNFGGSKHDLERIKIKREKKNEDRADEEQPLL